MASSSTATAASMAKKTGRATIFSIRTIVRYVERWFTALGKAIAAVYGSYRRAHVALCARTSSGTPNDQTLRILGVAGNIVGHIGILLIRIAWCFLQAI